MSCSHAYWCLVQLGTLVAGYQVNICLSVVTHAIYSLYLAVDTGYLSLTSHLSHTCTLVHPYSHSHTHTHTRLIYTYMCTGTHTYMCIHKHVTHTHTHTHTRPQSALLNESFELLLQFFACHAHCIGFPELSFPALLRVHGPRPLPCNNSVITHDVCILSVQLRQVAKTTPLSWLRMQLKQLIEKVCTSVPYILPTVCTCVLNIVNCMCVRWKR